MSVLPHVIASLQSLAAHLHALLLAGIAQRGVNAAAQLPNFERQGIVLPARLSAGIKFRSGCQQLLARVPTNRLLTLMPVHHFSGTTAALLLVVFCSSVSEISSADFSVAGELGSSTGTFFFASALGLVAMILGTPLQQS